MKEQDPEESNDAMVRWQGYAREHRTAVNTHFLTYTAAVLALQISILIDSQTTIIYKPLLFVISGIIALTSLVVGSVVVLVRLRDARLTARLARFKYHNFSKDEIVSLRSSVHKYGAWTNGLLPTQIILFVTSAICISVWLVLVHSYKLWEI